MRSAPNSLSFFHLASAATFSAAAGSSQWEPPAPSQEENGVGRDDEIFVPVNRPPIIDFVDVTPWVDNHGRTRCLFSSSLIGRRQ